MDKNPSTAVDRIKEIMTMIDLMLYEDLFRSVNTIFEELNPENLDAFERVAYLTATLPAASKLPARSMFLGKCVKLDDEELYKGLEYKIAITPTKDLYEET